MNRVMRRLLFLLFAATVSSPLLAADANPEHEKLLGMWQIAWVESNGEQNAPEGDAALPLTFKADVIELGEQKIQYTLDTETTPKLIDLKIKIGNEEKLRTLEGHLQNRSG